MGLRFQKSHWEYGNRQGHAEANGNAYGVTTPGKAGNTGIAVAYLLMYCHEAALCAAEGIGLEKHRCHSSLWVDENSR